MTVTEFAAVAAALALLLALPRLAPQPVAARARRRTHGLHQPLR